MKKEVEASTQTFPINIEPEAARQIKRLLAKDGRAEAFLRVGVKGGGCSGFEYVLKLDTARRESDHFAEISEIPVACDPKSAKFLEGSTLKWTGNLINGGFAFENPNAGKSCGCGTSFSLKNEGTKGQ
jgi:iron-sulfur cluster assembly protein